VTLIRCLFHTQTTILTLSTRVQCIAAYVSSTFTHFALSDSPSSWSCHSFVDPSVSVRSNR
jgi:hypothetical protein